MFFFLVLFYILLLLKLWGTMVFMEWTFLILANICLEKPWKNQLYYDFQYTVYNRRLRNYSQPKHDHDIERESLFSAVIFKIIKKTYEDKIQMLSILFKWNSLFLKLYVYLKINGIIYYLWLKTVVLSFDWTFQRLHLNIVLQIILQVDWESRTFIKNNESCFSERIAFKTYLLDIEYQTKDTTQISSI